MWRGVAGRSTPVLCRTGRRLAQGHRSETVPPEPGALPGVLMVEAGPKMVPPEPKTPKSKVSPTVNAVEPQDSPLVFNLKTSISERIVELASPPPRKIPFVAAAMDATRSESEMNRPHLMVAVASMLKTKRSVEDSVLPSTAHELSSRAATPRAAPPLRRIFAHRTLPVGDKRITRLTDALLAGDPVPTTQKSPSRVSVTPLATSVCSSPATTVHSSCPNGPSLTTYTSFLPLVPVANVRVSPAMIRPLAEVGAA